MHIFMQILLIIMNTVLSIRNPEIGVHETVPESNTDRGCFLIFAKWIQERREHFPKRRYSHSFVESMAASNTVPGTATIVLSTAFFHCRDYRFPGKLPKGEEHTSGWWKMVCKDDEIARVQKRPSINSKYGLRHLAECQKKIKEQRVEVRSGTTECDDVLALDLDLVAWETDYFPNMDDVVTVNDPEFLAWSEARASSSVAIGKLTESMLLILSAADIHAGHIYRVCATRPPGAGNSILHTASLQTM